MNTIPSQEQLRLLLEYHPETGGLFWKERPLSMFATERAGKVWNRRFAGKPAFTAFQGDGYLCGAIWGQPLLAHRVIWKLVYDEEPEQIDHEDHCRSNNRLSNLRAATNELNQKNKGRHPLNRSGANGVGWCSRQEQWRARGAQRHLGYFDSLEEAVAARSAFDQQSNYHPNHGASDGS